jgi:DNA-binding Lrp family transcriptional regulator
MPSDIEIRTLELFAAGYRLTRGELRERLGMHPDAETTSRIRALRKMGFGIQVERDSVLAISPGSRHPFMLARARRCTVYRYYLPDSERERALKFLTEKRGA